MCAHINTYNKSRFLQHHVTEWTVTVTSTNTHKGAHTHIHACTHARRHAHTHTLTHSFTRLCTPSHTLSFSISFHILKPCFSLCIPDLSVAIPHSHVIDQSSSGAEFVDRAVGRQVEGGWKQVTGHHHGHCHPLLLWWLAVVGNQDRHLQDNVQKDK